MGIPDWGPVCSRPRGKGPRTKKKRNALRLKIERDRQLEYIRSLPPKEIKDE